MNIPANSDHPPVGKNAVIKDKWKRTEFSKEQAAEFAAKQKEFQAKLDGEKTSEGDKPKK